MDGLVGFLVGRLGYQDEAISVTMPLGGWVGSGGIVWCGGWVGSGGGQLDTTW